MASYAVSLAATLQSMGHGVEGVFGLSVPNDVQLREAVFFDVFKRPPGLQPKTNRYQRLWRTLRAFRAPRPRTVTVSNNVEKLAFAGEMPAFERIATAAHLFEDASTFFALTGRFVQLRLAYPPEIMHWTYPIPILVRDVPNIYTLHDLVPLKLPYTTLDNKAIYGQIVAGCVKYAAQICTVSESSKKDIVERYGIDPKRISNTYQVATSLSELRLMSEAEDAYAVQGIFGLERRSYFLYFGAIEPKKNIGRLIEAYLSLQTRTPLVLVGARAWQSENELRLMPGTGADGGPGTYAGYRGQSIIRLDYLPRPLLAKLIRGAKAVVFPSLYEGFGLPVLEAMQLGTPVIASNTSSLPEVVGQAGLLLDPYDVDGLTSAMRQLDSDDDLGRRMAAMGLERAKFFSIEHYRRRLGELYDAAFTNGGRPIGPA